MTDTKDPQRATAEQVRAVAAKYFARDAATVWFGMDDPFASNGTRTIPKFASRASDCLLKARRALGAA